MPPTQQSAIHPSPKRKRDQPAHIPLLNTTLRIASTPPRGSPGPSSGADSPRNAVADQLRGMSIAALPMPMSPLTPTDDIVRKKPKLEALRETSLQDFTDSDIRTWELEQVPDTVDGGDSDSSSREIPETPQDKERASEQWAEQPRIFANLVTFAQPSMFASPSTEVPRVRFPLSSTASKSRNRSSLSQPRQRKKSPSPPLSSLTWQDSEITGHLVDPSIDPEDDGTGLNGIGFKPTPALAYARAQRRRQQLMDWKAREAKEARAKRTERRRRGVRTPSVVSREATPAVRDVPAPDVDARRSVKFAI